MFLRSRVTGVPTFSSKFKDQAEQMSKKNKNGLRGDLISCGLGC